MRAVIAFIRVGNQHAAVLIAPQQAGGLAQVFQRDAVGQFCHIVQIAGVTKVALAEYQAVKPCFGGLHALAFLLG